MTLRTTMLTSAFATAVVVAACGGSSHKKTLDGPDDAGAKGDAGAKSEAGATHNGMGGKGGMDVSEPSAGQAGSDTTDGAGAGGAAGAVSDGEGGEGGAAPLPALRVLFTVGAGAKGRLGSAVRDEPNPTSVIFGSSLSLGLGAKAQSPDDIAGSNRVAIRAAELGLAEGDTIDAFTALRPAPNAPVYLFSVEGPGVKSERPTRLHRSSLEDGAPGDVYFSDATLSFRRVSEGGDQFGYNGLLVNEQTLGLSVAPLNVDAVVGLDDLTGVLPLPNGVLPAQILFSVAPGSAGLAGSAVAATDSEELGCTIFKSNRDGKNTVAYTCAQLGVAAGSNVKGLALLGSGAEVEILFAVDPNGQGTGETALEAQNVYASSGTGTNSLRVEGRALGLSSDPIDALAVVDRAPAEYGVASSCELTPVVNINATANAAAVEGANLVQFEGAHGLGTDLILLKGRAQTVGDTAMDGIGAYNVKTCAFVARKDLAYNALRSDGWAPVKLAGWSAAAPLDNIEYWQLESGDGLLLRRLSAAGAQLGSYGFTGLQGTYTPLSLEYDGTNQRFVAVVVNPATGGIDAERLAFGRPANSSTAPIAVLSTPLPHPCAYPRVVGIDVLGDAYFAQLDQTQSDQRSPFRICALSALGELADLPFKVAGSGSNSTWLTVSPGEAVYELIPGYLTDSTAFTLSRHALGTPLLP